MDEIDLSIIEKLTEDARMSYRKIAKELGISQDTVINRYKKLKNKGVVLGSTVVVDPKKIGYHGMAVFGIDVSPSHILATEATMDSSLILDKLIKMRNIIVATKTVGTHDLLAICVIFDFEHLIKLREDIAKISGVKDLEVSFWIKKTEIYPKYFII